MARRDAKLLSRIAMVSLLHSLVLCSGLAQEPALTMPPACVMSGSRILAEASKSSGEPRSVLISVDPATSERIAIPVMEPRQAIALYASGVALVENAGGRWALVAATRSVAVPLPDLAVFGLTLGQSLVSLPARWVVDRYSGPNATSFRMIDRSTRAVVLETSFVRRIELAASASSADGRFFVHVQANNLASEVFAFDGMTLNRRTASLRHDARLAAFAISLTFSPDASCLAISMEREGDPTPGTWIIDLTANALKPVWVDLGFVLAWLPTGEGAYV